MTSSEFVVRVYSLNLVAGVNEVQEVAKQLFPNCINRQLGFFNGYSPIIENGQVLLRSYEGEIDKGNVDDDIFEDIDNSEYALGTIFIEIGDTHYQIYHKGIGLWFAEDSDSEFYELGSYQNAIQYLFNLKNSQ